MIFSCPIDLSVIIFTFYFAMFLFCASRFSLAETNVTTVEGKVSHIIKTKA